MVENPLKTGPRHWRGKAAGALLLAGVLLAWTGGVARANQLVFKGQNAALFSGANPADTAALMNSVKKPSGASSTEVSSYTSSELILRSLQSQISARIYNDIFSGDSATGTYDLGDGSSVTYLHHDGVITITIVDKGGTVTELTVPDI